MVSYDGVYAYCEGFKFRLEKKTGYYLSTRKTDAGKRERLHVFVWRRTNGEIPTGCDIHHRDGDKNNNEPSNLECMSKSEHESLHRTEYSRKNHGKILENLRKNACPKAAEWHRSNDGKEWHRAHPPVIVVKTFVCANCGQDFDGAKRGTNRFCCNRCKSAFRRKSGIDDIEAQCLSCGKTFVKNKYSTAKYCSFECRMG